MKESQNQLEELKNKNPFLVPEGYMEGLTSRIMSQLPEKKNKVEAKKVNMFDRVRPWLYIAALFAGISFGVTLFLKKGDYVQLADSEMNQGRMPERALSSVYTTDEEEYFEYLETRYSGYILEEELADFE